MLNDSQKVPCGWQLIFSLLLLCCSLLGLSQPVFSQNTSYQSMLSNAENQYQQGNYRVAFSAYEQVLLNNTITSNDEAEAFAEAFSDAIDCLDELEELTKFDDFVASVVDRHPNQWQILVQAADAYLAVDKSGYLIEGEFERGYHRGGGRYANSAERDRVKALQLYRRAWALLEADLNTQADPDSDNFLQLLQNIAETFVNDYQHETWRLQTLTGLSSLPEYEEGYNYSDRVGAPVDYEGNIVIYQVPVSFDAAQNDGERWRYILKQIASINEEGKNWASKAWADFLWKDYGVQTMAQSLYRFYGQENESSELEKSIFDLAGLSNDETLAKLATGIKRFNFPPDYNFINHYVLLSQSNSITYKTHGLESLATIFENRRQLSLAAHYWQRLLDETSTNEDANRAMLSQIVGAWAQFEPLNTVAKNATNKQVGLRFRNANSVKFTAREINTEKLITDIKNYLNQSSNEFDWYRLDIASVGRQLIDGDKTYQGEILKTWVQALQPASLHQDKVTSIDLPPELKGIYLLEAEVAGGNTNYIVVWNSESIIVRKPMQEGQFYFVADAVTGKPLNNKNLHFFGFRQEWNRERVDNSNRNATQRIITTKEFSAKTNRNGQVIIDKNKQVTNHQWLVHTDTKNNDAAFLGFNSVWYHSNNFERLEQTKAYIISNQPAYRPGQKVQMNAWVQTPSYNDTRKNNNADKTYTLIVSNPRGEKILEQQLVSDTYGGIQYSLDLSSEAQLGVYGVSVEGISGFGQFRVEEYKKPEFEVTIETPDKPVALGETINAVVKADYYFGAAVTNATVKIKVERFEHNARWFPFDPWDWLYGNGYWWFASDMDWYPGWNRWGMSAPQHSWLRPNFGGQPELVQQTETSIGADGRAEITIDTEFARLLHGDKDHRYQVSVEVIDSSRRSVYGSGDILVARQPFKVFTWVDKGYYQTGDTVTASFKAQTLDQKPVQGTGKALLYRLHYDENKNVNETLVEEWTLDNNDDGSASLTLNANRAGQHRLVYQLEDESGHQEQGAYVFNIVGANAVADENLYRFDALELIADHKNYSPNEELNLLVNSRFDDAHVLLFERPNNNYSSPKIVNVKNGSHRHSLELESEDRPNIFVEALTIRNGEVFTQVREIALPPQQSLINVELEANKEEFKPGENVDIRVQLKDEAGNPFTGSTVIAVYDKALDYIAGGVKPQPILDFYWNWKRHHNPQTISSVVQFYPLVKNSDQAMQTVGIFGDRILETDSGGQVEEIVVTASTRGRSLASEPMADAMMLESPAPLKAQSAPAPVDGNNNQQITARSEFADSAFWISNLQSDDKGIATASFKLPDNLTTWSTNAWAIGENTEVGQNSLEIITKKNLLLRLQAPRFFIEKDEVVLSANVHNYLLSGQNVDVALQLDGDEIQLMEGEQAIQTIQLDENGERRVDWRIKVNLEGTAKIRMVANNTTSSNESDVVELSFPVYVHGQLLTQSYSGSLNSEQQNGLINFSIPEQRRPEQSRLELRYSPSLAGAMVDALPYLVDFPYGCTEQTLSRFLPTVMVQQILQQSNINLEAIKQKQTNLNAQEIGDDSERSKQWQQFDRNPVFDRDLVSTMSENGLNRLINMQLNDGGWGWFSGWGERSSPHTTAYVVHGLQVARSVGLDVNEEIYQRGIEWLQHYQSQELQKINNSASRTQPYKNSADNLDAFVAMVLADAGLESNAMLNRLYQDRLALSVYGQSMLALALDTVNRNSERDLVKQNIEQYLIQDEENQTAYLNLPNAGYWWRWYGSEYEAQAYYLKLLSRLEPNGEVAPQLVKHLLNNRKHANYWNSTRDTAIVIEALSEFFIASGESNPDVNLTFKLDGEEIKTVSINQDNLFDFDNKLVLEGEALESGNHQLEITKTGSGPLYYNAYVTNFSLEDKLQQQGLEVKVKRRYFKLTSNNRSENVVTSTGQVSSQQVEQYTRSEIDENTKLNSGDLIEIELAIESKNDYEYIIIEDMKAAGFEPVSVQSGYNGNELGAYVEYRDNRVAFFVQNLARGNYSLSYRMKAEIPGRFNALPTKIEAMYAPELKGNSDSNQLAIFE